MSTATSNITRWYVLMMMCLVYTLSIADRYVVTTVLDPMRIDLGLSDSGIAFLTGAALAWFYVVFGLPLSWLVDRSSRRNIIAFSMMAWSVMTVLTGLARTQAQMLLARIGVGIGEAGATPAANSILSDYFPVARRPMALTVFALGLPIGAWVASALAGAIADRYGWRQVFIVLGAPGVAAGALLLLTVREPRRGQCDAHAAGAAPGWRETLRFLWSQRAAVHVLLACALGALWGWGLMFWTPAYLQRAYHLSPGETGAILGPMHLWGGIGATLLTAWWVSRPSMADPRRICVLMGSWIVVATFVSFAVYWTRSLAMAELWLWLFVPSIYFYNGPSFGILNNLAQPQMRAMFCAVMLFVGNVGNLVVAPQFVGFISDSLAPPTGPTANSLRIALLCLTPTGFWCAAHYFLALPRLLSDQERATGRALPAMATGT